MSLQAQEVMRVAGVLFAQLPKWTVFHAEVFGVDGLIRKAFPTSGAQRDFEETADYQKLQGWLQELRLTTPPADDDVLKVITVRLPKTLHESLQVEAHENQTSMNQLCISKLLQPVAPAFMGGRKQVAALQSA